MDRAERLPRSVADASFGFEFHLSELAADVSAPLSQWVCRRTQGRSPSAKNPTAHMPRPEARALFISY